MRPVLFLCRRQVVTPGTGDRDFDPVQAAPYERMRHECCDSAPGGHSVIIPSMAGDRDRTLPFWRLMPPASRSLTPTLNLDLTYGVVSGTFGPLPVHPTR